MAVYKFETSVAMIGIKNPPVNALGGPVRKGIMDGLQRALQDPQIKSIVIYGEGKTFPAGADIKEFGNPSQFWNAPGLTEICNAIEDSAKPVVAAVHGTALGGGCEIAISCHYRVVHQDSRFGFPEVEIGILPAATGTQRFPRLCGLKAALDYIPTGRSFTAKTAQNMGMVDKLVKENLVNEAVRFAKSVETKSMDGRRTSRLKVKGQDRSLIEAAYARANQKNRGQLSPIYCIKSVCAAIDLPFEEGLMKEAELASVLFTSSQARGLQHAFFAQRAATKWRMPGGADFTNTQPLPVKKAAVIGAGTMGTGIAMAILNARIPVVLIEQNKELLEKGVAALRGLYEGSVKLGRVSSGQVNLIFRHLLTPSLTYDKLQDVDLVIEAVFEDMEIKKQVFRKLEQACPAHTVLCSNTSTLSITELATAVSTPERVVGTHFFVPAYHMKLLENVRGDKTSPQTVATVMNFGQRIGKIPVLVGTCFGFVGNRLSFPKGAEAVFLVEEGALPHEVDQVLEEFGFPLGVFKVGDLSGLDVSYRIRRGRAQELGVRQASKGNRFIGGMRSSYLADVLYEHKRFGRKTGCGYYRYEKPGAKEPFPDKAVEDIVVQYSKENGIQRRKIPQNEILERCIYSLINEGFKVLEEGIADKPEDIDAIWFLGYGWPRYTGGPMFYAQQVGLEKVYETICKYHKEHASSPHWQPSELLRRLATQGLPLKDWKKVQLPSQL